MTANTARPMRSGLRFRGRTALAIAAMLGGGGLVAATPAQGFQYGAPSLSLPSQVTVGETFPAALGIANFSTPPQSTTDPVLRVSAIDLVPACAIRVPDCAGGIEAGVFQATDGLGFGSSAAQPNPTCDGMWTVAEISPGTLRLTPPEGEGSLLVGTGDTCVVTLAVTALRTPTTDTDAAPGIQTVQVASATFQGETLPSFRNSGMGSSTTVVPAPVAPPADFDGTGTTDPAVYRPSNRVWYSPGSSVEWGAADDIAVPGDYDGDGQTDQAVYRPASGVWYVNGSLLGASSGAWGVGPDIPVPADYDGDNRTDRAVYRPATGEWFVSRSGGGATAVAWGTGSDIPVPGDYDGDGNADLAVFRPSTGVWYVSPSGGGAGTSTAWGSPGDSPVPGDYDGDGRTDPAVFRPSESVWYVVPSGGGAPTSPAWGTEGDIPVPGDFDADGLTDLAVFRPSSGVWYVQYSTGGETATAWGVEGDVPLPLPAAIGRVAFSPPFS